jgi:hypothetical protein
MITTLGCVRGVVGVVSVVGVVGAVGAVGVVGVVGVVGDGGVGGFVGVEDADATLHHIANNAPKKMPRTAIDELAHS